MTTKSKQLVRAGHELASELKADCGAVDMRSVANLLTELASALDVQSARSDALAVECDAVNADNVYLRDQVLCWARECDRITYTYTNKLTDAHQSEAEQELANTVPATDAFLAEVRAQARREGVNFAAARLAAAFNNGFIDKPTAEVYDVVKAVLGAKEELATAPDDGLSGEYAEQALNDWAAQLRGSQV
ncbi:hypothetical protein [Atlantibacter hermannii]|uniref:hypothetical protein n=1 Tax=Atlantibacter hermannii TaxID=565 RepID=UPI00289BA3B4|nr:hypothetical protein [Atlantibacter hermannii]